MCSLHNSHLCQYVRAAPFPPSFIFALYSYRLRTGKRNKKRVLIDRQFKELLQLSRSPGFSNSIRTYILALPRRKMSMVLYITEEILLNDGISSRIALLVKDLIASVPRYLSNTTTHILSYTHLKKVASIAL